MLVRFQTLIRVEQVLSKLPFLLSVAVLPSLTGCQQIMDRLVANANPVSPASTPAPDQSNSGSSAATATVLTQPSMPAQTQEGNKDESLGTTGSKEDVQAVPQNAKNGSQGVDRSVRKQTLTDHSKSKPEINPQTASSPRVNTLKTPGIDGVRVYIED